MKWYLDSGCSRHMTRDPNLFTTLSSCKSGTVTFGDDEKSKIIGIETVGKKSYSILENVLLVDGLKANLISISQLCDKGMNVILDLVNALSLIVKEIFYLKHLEMKMSIL